MQLAPLLSKWHRGPLSAPLRADFARVLHDSNHLANTSCSRNDVWGTRHHQTRLPRVLRNKEGIRFSRLKKPWVFAPRNSRVGHSPRARYTNDSCRNFGFTWAGTGMPITASSIHSSLTCTLLSWLNLDHETIQTRRSWYSSQRLHSERLHLS